MGDLSTVVGIGLAGLIFVIWDGVRVAKHHAAQMEIVASELREIRGALTTLQLRLKDLRSR